MGEVEVASGVEGECGFGGFVGGIVKEGVAGEVECEGGGAVFEGGGGGGRGFGRWGWGWRCGEHLGGRERGGEGVEARGGGCRGSKGVAESVVVGGRRGVGGEVVV